MAHRAGLAKGRGIFLLGALAGSWLCRSAFAYGPDPGCTTLEAWMVQSNPLTDVTGKNNIAFPLQQATYWGMQIDAKAGLVLTIRGQYPAARYMSFELYDPITQQVRGDIDDDSINPDFGQNNPFRPGGGPALGSYTIQVVFGPQPTQPAPNTMYTNGSQTVILLYRVYYPNDPDILTGGTSSPVLPLVFAGPVPLATCAPRPIIIPPTATVWGREAQNNFVGQPPPFPILATNPPSWTFHSTSTVGYFPSQDNNYISAMISRKYLTAPYNYNIAVVQMKPPTFNNTQAGDPPYGPADVRLWAMCTYEPLSSGVVRCVPDNQAPVQNNVVTFVVSDPAYKPPDSVLDQWGASWLAWGALGAGDYVYSDHDLALTNADGVFYDDVVIYRQTVSRPWFLESIANISTVPQALQQLAMGAYWPQIGYCTLEAFQSVGAACMAADQAGGH